MPTAYHMVHYRKFGGEGLKDGATLEALCRAALSTKDSANSTLWERVKDRFQDLSDAEGRQISLNKVADLSTAVFGEMCLVQEHGLQALLALNASKIQLSNITLAEVFDLNESQAPKGTQFIRGMAYWIAINNNLLFVKTQSMSSDMMHNYLIWLIGSKIPSGANPKFQAEFDRSQAGGDIGEIKSMRVSGKSMPQMSLLNPNSNEYQKSVKTSRRISENSYVYEKAESIVEIIFGKKKTESLVESMGPEEYLTVDAAVKVQGKRTEASREKLKEIVNDLADVEDAKVQVEGKDGKFSEEDAIIRTRMPFELAHSGSNLLEFDNVADQLQEVYSRFVRDGKIDA